MTNDGSGARTHAPGAAIDRRQELDQLVGPVAEDERGAFGQRERPGERRFHRVAALRPGSG